MYFFILWFPPDICPGVGLLGHMVHAKSLQSCPTLWTPWTVAMGFVNGILQAYSRNAGVLYSRFPLSILYMSVSHSVTSDSLWSYGLKPTRFLCPWNSPGKNRGVGSHSLLCGIFPIQGSNPGLLHCRQILCLLSHWGSPILYIVVCICQPSISLML